MIEAGTLVTCSGCKTENVFIKGTYFRDESEMVYDPSWCRMMKAGWRMIDILDNEILCPKCSKKLYEGIRAWGVENDNG